LLDISTNEELQAEAEELAKTLLGTRERLEQRNFSERLAPTLEVPAQHNSGNGLNYQAIISAL
jgi:hypothetical protein